MAEKNSHKPDFHGDDAKVLIVDDNPANLEVIESSLREHGFTTLVARNGEIALKRISHSRPDIILLDVMMPGIDGFETCRRLKANNETKEIPVIFMTALADPEHKITGFSVGAVDYITKPVQKDELLARVTTHLKIHRYQEHLEREVRKRTDDLEGHMRALENEIAVRKQAEKELGRLRNYLKNIIDSMPSVLVGVDSKGHVTQWNKTAERYTGITAADAHGKFVAEVFPGMAPDMEKIVESIRSRQLKQEQRPCHGESGPCYEDVTIYPLVANGVEGAVIRIDDVTEEVRMQEMIVQSEKMLSVGGLAAGIAHEINNPMAGMIQTSDVLSHRLANVHMPANLRAAEEIGIDMEDIRAFMDKRGILQMIETINESGRRVAGIVDNMLRFARKSDAPALSHDISELLDQALALAASEYDLKQRYDFKDIGIVKEYEENLPVVPCERSKIQQVMLNILRNGAQAMLEVSGKRNHRFILRLATEKRAGMLRMEIEDNGPGMDEETCNRVFEPFFTTKPSGIGTGLGLSVSYFIITENHGGTLDVTSEPGKGTSFIIRLPLAGKNDR